MSDLRFKRLDGDFVTDDDEVCTTLVRSAMARDGGVQDLVRFVVQIDRELGAADSMRFRRLLGANFGAEGRGAA